MLRNPFYDKFKISMFFVFSAEWLFSVHLCHLMEGAVFGTRSLMFVNCSPPPSLTPIVECRDKFILVEILLYFQFSMYIYYSVRALGRDESF